MTALEENSKLPYLHKVVLWLKERRPRFWWLLVLVLLIQSQCCMGITPFGPYRGRVVERETDKPIPGAVVFVEFNTLFPTVAGPNADFADAVETLTDEKGEFYIPVQWVFVFRPLSHWGSSSAQVYKPGYGGFPRHSLSIRQSRWGEWDPESEKKCSFGECDLPPITHATIRLPRLLTKEEREGNWPRTTGIPFDKRRLLSEAEKVGDEFRWFSPKENPKKYEEGD